MNVAGELDNAVADRAEVDGGDHAAIQTMRAR